MQAEDFCCGVCEEQYGDNRPPRILTCGHSLCTFCVQQIFTRDSRCPECRARITVSKGKDPPVNFELLRLARSFGKVQAEQQKGCQVLEGKPGQDPDAGECKAHGSRLLFICCKCYKWVCRNCLVVDHRQPPLGQCNIMTFSQAMFEAKNNNKSNTSSLLQKITQMKVRLSRTKSFLLLKEREHKKEIAKLLEEVHDIPHKVDEVNNHLKTLDSCPAVLKATQNCVDQAQTLEELKASTETANARSDSTNLLLDQAQQLVKKVCPT
ncbi:postreplication repair E3 ubiquitin-protein ligase rad18-like [Homarus americanus]|uniref:E3 ubiquitin-protein ligase TRIM11-like n=1 Tax=Homarus americanus TaxID=6706 RepID=A0A8J5TDX4_HOMAM|nr:postreplication repair E3 ubiquitin-protein ligase rad18-like [Homarus americanus]KAG7174764.1 E3 ubiquitin-protein ligase TRIM11-like [Homarus americanus]